MKTTTIFKTFALVAIISSAMIFSGCKGKEKPKQASKGATELIIPCKDEGRSDKNHFRADNSSTSADMTLSREKALTLAKQRLASLINTKIKSVTDRYVNETEVGENSDFEQKFENLTREVVNQSLSDVRINCEKTFQEANGKYTTYIAIEVNKDDLLNGVNKGLTKDQKLRVDYDKMKYEKIFDEEMEKLEKEAGY
ncbi:MAG: hypothetical protein GX879_04320 [Bacteroidales bacterium]|nr:hypothetical protein [Bacteroidales bacterium]